MPAPTVPAGAAAIADATLTRSRPDDMLSVTGADRPWTVLVMASAEHQQILQQGPGVWNQWRSHNPGIVPELADADLSQLNLVGASLRGADLRRAKFGSADVTGTDLRESNLRGADLSGVTGPLQSEQVAGADLAGAALPESLRELFKD